MNMLGVLPDMKIDLLRRNTTKSGGLTIGACECAAAGFSNMRTRMMMMMMVRNCSRRRAISGGNGSCAALVEEDHTQCQGKAH